MTGSWGGGRLRARGLGKGDLVGDSPFKAALYDAVLAPAEALLIRRWRLLLWKQVAGPRVMELGVGTGLNIPHYGPHIEVTALDHSSHMLKRALRRAEAAGKEVNLVRGDALQLEFPPESFDSVVATFLFCSVSEPSRVLSSIHRVLKPEGELLMLEHGRSRGILGRMMTWMAEPLYRLTGDHIARDMLCEVQQHPFKDIERQDLLLDVVRLIRCRKA